MASLSKIILYSIALAFPFGQLLRLNLFNISFPLIDLLVVILSFSNLFRYLKSPQPRNRYFFYFLLFCPIGLIINYFLHPFPVLKPLFYLLRLSSFLLLLIYPLPETLFDNNFNKFFRLSLISTVLFGLIQYFLWPDFTFMKSLEWDPHLYRLVGSFFDPTFTGLIFLLFFIIAYLSKNLLFTDYCLLITIYLAIALTYSRSTLLALIAGFAYLSFRLKNSKFFYFSLLLVGLTWLLLPQNPGEGNNLYRTSTIRAKIVNYREGIRLFSKSPLIGFGYNTLGLIRPNPNPNSHHLYGFDSSLLTILVTTGLVGLIFFVLGLKQLFSSVPLCSQVLLIVILFHSLFANSLLYPWVLVTFIFSRYIRYRR